jgi:hypothetical protein
VDIKRIASKVSNGIAACPADRTGRVTDVADIWRKKHV